MIKGPSEPIRSQKRWTTLHGFQCNYNAQMSEIYLQIIFKGLSESLGDFVDFLPTVFENFKGPLKLSRTLRAVVQIFQSPPQ